MLQLDVGEDKTEAAVITNCRKINTVKIRVSNHAVVSKSYAYDKISTAMMVMTKRIPNGEGRQITAKMGSSQKRVSADTRVVEIKHGINYYLT